MPSIFDFMDPTRQPAIPRPESDLLAATRRLMHETTSEIEAGSATFNILTAASSRHGKRINDAHTRRAHDVISDAERVLGDIRKAQGAGSLALAWQSYLRDAGERAILTADTLRKRGDVFLQHEEAGCPPVLVYDYDVVMDGKDLPYPSNYMLLRITPPEGITVIDTKRPYIIIDPRAGHGPGIGGFKADSQVGVALRDGHPVYFVAFRREPEP